MTFEQAQIELEKIPAEVKGEYQIELSQGKYSNAWSLNLYIGKHRIAISIDDLNIINDGDSIAFDTPNGMVKHYNFMDGLLIVLL